MCISSGARRPDACGQLPIQAAQPDYPSTRVREKQPHNYMFIKRNIDIPNMPMQISPGFQGH